MGLVVPSIRFHRHGPCAKLYESIATYLEVLTIRPAGNQDRASTLFGSQFLRTSTCCGRTKLTSVHLGSTTTVSSKGWPFFVTLALSSVNATVTRFHALPITADNQTIYRNSSILAINSERDVIGIGTRLWSCTTLLWLLVHLDMLGTRGNWRFV